MTDDVLCVRVFIIRLRVCVFVCVYLFVCARPNHGGDAVLSCTHTHTHAHTDLVCSCHRWRPQGVHITTTTSSSTSSSVRTRMHRVPLSECLHFDPCACVGHVMHFCRTCYSRVYECVRVYLFLGCSLQGTWVLESRVCFTSLRRRNVSLVCSRGWAA